MSGKRGPGVVYALVAAAAVAIMLVGIGNADAQTTTTECGGSGLPPCETTTTTTQATTTTTVAATTTSTVAATTTTAPAGFDQSQDLGNKFEGDAFAISNNCGFLPGASATKTFNGTGVGGVLTVPANGCVGSNITILSDGVALGLRPVFAAVGLRLAQASSTPQVRIDGVTVNGNALGVRNALVVQSTAAAGGTGRWTNYFTIVRKGAAGAGVGAGALGRTGAMILRWSLLGGALVALGALFVLSARRRRAA